MTLTDAAAAYGIRGWRTFPVNGKKPLVEWADKSSTGTDAYTHTPVPPTGIGVDCGKSALVVVDIDDLDSYATWLVDTGHDMPDTLVATTPSGGKHLYFTALPDRPIRNSASKLAPGVDIRGQGGYVVAPPSPGYVWTHRTVPVPFPGWLADLIEQAAAKPKTSAPNLPTPTLDGDGTADRWGRRILEAELARIAMSVPGQRNTVFFEAACNIFEAVKGGHIDESHAWSILGTAGTGHGLDIDEVNLSLDSAWQRTEPRHPKEPLKQTPTTAVTGAAIPPPQPRPAAHHQPGGLRVMSLDDLDDMPPARWLLNRRLPEGMTVLYGKPGAGKTFVALDWSMTVAAVTGEPVLYFAGEGVSGLRDRTRAWRAAHAQYDAATFHVVPQVPLLLDPTSVVELRGAVAEVKPALLVVDTLARSLAGGDENSATDVGHVVRTLDSIRAEYGTSSLILHHTNVAGDRERGSTALRGAADAMWKVTGDFDGFTLSCDKLKDGEYPGESRHRFRQVGQSVVLHPSTSSLVDTNHDVGVL